MGTVLRMIHRVIWVQGCIRNTERSPCFYTKNAMTDKSNKLPFTIIRQFLIKLAFCLTINKVRFYLKFVLFQGQGHINERVGIYLPNPVFAHSQLYTGLSLGCRKWDIHLYLDRETEGFTNNIVSLNFLRKLRVVNQNL